MHRRLFWQLLTAFAVLIVLGVGGTALLTYVGYRQIAARNRIERLIQIEPVIADNLSDYYLSHNNSWTGVADRLNVDGRLPQTVGYVLWDRAGTIVAQGGPATLSGRNLRPAQGTSILAANQRVGSFALLLAGAERQRIPALNVPRRPLAAEETLDRRVRRVFLLVALILGGAMLGLAVLVSRRISTPLRKLTLAAQDVAGGTLGITVPPSSITEIDALGAAFNRMSAELRRADALRRNMTADIAHELRTPLTIIRGKLEGVLDGVYPASCEELAPVLEEVALLERLINDLRTLSLAEAGQLPLHREPLSIEDLLHDIARSFAPQAAQHGVTLHVDVAPQIPALMLDPARMQQVLGNLVTNSLRYTPPGGAIRLNAAQQAGRLHMFVQDTGSGIAPADLPHIWDRFWRSDRARSRSGSSTGLGLTIARELVEAHGGRISAASQPGHGTTITIDLPIEAAPVATV